MSSSAIRRGLEDLLEKLEQQRPGRYPGFIRPEESQPDSIPTGIGKIDRLTGGLPRGRITEICGPESSGRTTLLLSTLAQTTENESFCGFVDPAGTLDPASAKTAGVRLDRLLWVRTRRNVDATLKVLDLLVQGGGFGLIGIDLGEVSPTEIQCVPYASWFRFQRAIENTPTVLLFITRAPAVKTCASLVLSLKPEHIRWSRGLLYGIQSQAEIVRSHPGTGGLHHSDSFDFQSPDCIRAVRNTLDERLHTRRSFQP